MQILSSLYYWYDIHYFKMKSQIHKLFIQYVRKVRNKFDKTVSINF
jgi:hypothetical protein